MFSKMNVPIRKITTEEIRAYLSEYQENSHCTNVTVDNIRRNISSFLFMVGGRGLHLKVR